MVAAHHDVGARRDHGAERHDRRKEHAGQQEVAKTLHALLVNRLMPCLVILARLEVDGRDRDIGHVKFDAFARQQLLNTRVKEEMRIGRWWFHIRMFPGFAAYQASSSSSSPARYQLPSSSGHSSRISTRQRRTLAAEVP